MSTRMQILKMVESGQISADEAMQLLAAINGAEPLDQDTESLDQVALPEEMEISDAPYVETAHEPPVPQVGNWWLVPIIAGAAVMAIGALVVAMGLTGRAAIFWAIFCGWGPFLTGLVILALGFWSHNAPWLHLRITNTRSGKRTFALSLPLPLIFSAWMLRLIRPFVPKFQDTKVDEVILALRDGLKDVNKNQPFYVDVQDNQDGEQVKIYIG